MSYDYATQRYVLSTARGRELLQHVRESAIGHCAEHGYVSVVALIQDASKAMGAVDAWDVLACIDRLAEDGTIRRCDDTDGVTQFRLYELCSPVPTPEGDTTE